MFLLSSVLTSRALLSPLVIHGENGGAPPLFQVFFPGAPRWRSFTRQPTRWRKNVRAPCTSDLQKSRHLQKSRVTERHNRGTKRKLKSHPRPKKGAKRFFLRQVRLQFLLCAPIVPLRDATFLQMTRLLQLASSLLDTFFALHTDEARTLLRAKP